MEPTEPGRAAADTGSPKPPPADPEKAAAACLAIATVLANAFLLSNLDPSSGLAGLVLSALLALAAIWSLAETRKSASLRWIPLTFCISCVALLLDLLALFLFAFAPR